LIVTHYPGYDNYSVARHQVAEVLERATVVDSGPSIFFLLVDDPYKAVSLLREKLPRETPILRVVPVDAVVDVFVDRVGATARDVLYSKSKPEEAFAVKLDGRLYARSEGSVKRLSTMEAVVRIASYIERPVRLKNPDWLVYVKTVKLYRTTELASITVARPQDILSFAKGRGA